MVGTWTNDLDSFGQQDPFFKFMYRGASYETKVQDDAGKRAEFHESFLLDGIGEAVFNGDEVVFKSYDKDIIVDDHLGSTRPAMWQDFVKD